MYKRIIGLVLLFALMATPTSGQKPGDVLKPLNGGEEAPRLTLPQILEKPGVAPLTNPTKETEDAVLYLEKLDEEDRPYIKFFTTYAVPQEKRDNCVLALSFVLHSLVGINEDAEGNAGAYYPLAVRKTDDEGKTEFIKYRQVPDSETLWWIDIREFNWSLEAMEKISAEEPYFVEPIVEHKRSSILRLLSGNAVFRADWFIYAATDTQLQQDASIEFTIYETLLYNSLEKPPAVLEEWRQFWGLDIKQAKKLGTLSSALVTKSNAVARHNRILDHYPTYLGWHYETWDVNHQRGLRDYVEAIINIIVNGNIKRDGGEAFASNGLHMQVYLLYAGNEDGTLENGQEKIANVADGRLARHLSDVLGDARVITARSCFDCHSAGPIMPENTLKEFVGTLRFKTKADKLRADRIWLSGKFEDSVDDNQVKFARALEKVNGLEPEENQRIFLEQIKWYNRDVDVAQAALECGLDKETFIKKLREKTRLPGRLNLLVAPFQNESIPREVWGSPGADGIPGIFQQTMVALYGLTKLTETETVEREVQFLRIIRDGVSILGPSSPGKNGTVIRRADKGEEFEIVRELPNNTGVTFYEIKTTTGKQGFIKKTDTELKR